MFTRIIENRRYRCHSLPISLAETTSQRDTTDLHLHTNGSAINDTLVTFSKTPFIAGNAKKKTSRRGGVEWNVLRGATRMLGNARGVRRGMAGGRREVMVVRERKRLGRGRNMVSCSRSCVLSQDERAIRDCNTAECKVGRIP
jgi:hypothetical protein